MANSNLTPVAQSDYEFIGLSFGEKNGNPVHSSEFNLTVVQDGLTVENLTAEFEDDIVNVNGRESSYYFGTTYRPQQIVKTLAFDNLTSKNKKDIMQWLNPKKIKKLSFDESPHKYYWAKVISTPSFSFVPFEEDTPNGLKHIYKGTIEVTFLTLDSCAYGDYALLSEIKTFGSEGWHTIYNEMNVPGWFEGTDLLLSDDGTYYINSGKEDGEEIAGPVTGDFAKEFYNAGTEEVYPYLKFSFTGAQTSIKITNTTNDSFFELENLESQIWVIEYDPFKGSCIGTYLEGEEEISINLSSFVTSKLKISFLGNVLSTDKEIENIVIKYKHKYL